MVRERYEGLMQSILNGSSVQATTLVLLDFAPLLAAVILGSARAIRTWRRRVQLVEKDRLLDVFIKEEDVLAIVDLGEDDLAPEQLKAPTALLVLPLMELAAWLAFSAYSLARRASLEWTSAGRLSVAASWAYCFCTELRKRSRQPPWSTFVIFIVLFVRACVVSTIEWHDSTRQPDYKFNSFLLSLPDLCICGALIIRVVDMPLGASFARNVDRDDGAQPNSPEDRNTLLGSLSYAWMAPLMSLARRRPLRPSDVWQLALTNRAAVLARRFKLINASTLFERIFRASARDVAIDTALKWVAVSLSYLRPFWIQRLLEMLSLASVSISGDANRLPEVEHAPWTPRDRAYLYAIAAFLSLAGASLAQLQHFHHARRVGMRLRSELTSSVYEKALKRKDLSGQVHAAGRTGETAPKEGGASTGRIVSLISDDTNKVLRWGCDWHVLAGAPLELILALAFLWNLMGWSGLVGIAVLAIASPINFKLGQRAVRISRRRAAARDSRQSALHELLTSQRAIKFFGWTTAWQQKVNDKREAELSLLVREWRNQFYVTLLWFLVSITVPVLSFACYTKVQGEQMTVAVGFTALNYFAMVRGPLNQIPEFGIKILQCMVSIKRIERFLQEEEIEDHARPENRNRSDPSVAFRNATLRYPGATDADFTLSDVDADIPSGCLTLVSGETGSGKSSLLLALLGELNVVQGSVILPSTVSYAAQHPWLESATIRDAILFGQTLDVARYQAVLEACALLPDLDVLPTRDYTLVGERGVSLSGGQRARIALARAVYAPTSVVLLDDVLSAVDSSTGRHLYEKVLVGPLLRGRTVVLCTHHKYLVLPGVSYHIELQGGRIISQGLVEKVGLAGHLDDVDAACDGDSTGSEANDSGVDIDADPEQPSIEAETWVTGAVKGFIFRTYLSASSYFLWLALLIIICARPSVSFLEQFWLRTWGEDPSSEDTDFYIAGFALIGLAYVVLLVVYTVAFYAASLRASRAIFAQLLDQVIHAPSRWFDCTPMGRITNRFTNDVSTLDDSLAQNFSSVATNVFSMAASLVVTVVLLPSAVAPTAVASAIYGFIFVRFLRVSRDLNRIASTTASPLFSGFHHVLVGVSTIRAFSAEEAYRSRVMRVLDDTLSLWYASCTLDVWLSVRTQLLSALILLTTSFLSIYTTLSPGLAGIVISSSLYLLQYLDTLCTGYGKLVTSLNSLERITEYLNLPQEASGGKIPPAHWPASSRKDAMVAVEHLEIRYAPELEPSLRDVSFNVKAGERVAIVGRTGSGKSTLAMSLLRFVEPAQGRITVDGLDITSVPLDVLRSRITLLPQDAALFSGTLRQNIDPFDEYSDEACLRALQRTHLLGADDGGSGTSTPTSYRPPAYTLDTIIAGGGASLSAGQKQLVSLARAILRDSRILILDECSSSIDPDLDARVQKTIREEFSDACVLTIAHRLRTVIDYDRCLVLDKGRVIEFDTPTRLMETKGAFYELCRESGDFDELLAALNNEDSA